MIPGPPRLEARIALRTARRLARLRRHWSEAGRRLEELRATLGELPALTRRRILYGPDLRGFLGEAEIWIEILNRAKAAARSGARGRPDRAIAGLFDRIARTEHLTTLVPAGRLEPGLPRRATAFARLRLRQALQDLGGFLLGLRVACGRGGRLDIACTLSPDPEQGRPGNRIDLGAIAGPAGPLTIVFGGRRPPRRVDIRLEGRLLTVRAPGRTPLVIPAPGSRLHAWGPPPGRSVQGRGRPVAIRLARRESIPGTSILLTPGLESSPRRLLVAGEVPGLGRRLARALRIVRLAWPEGHREILAQTFMVVPVREPGLVSYSLASRPGVSFINVAGKTSFDLADDLLHESAHHRLHAMQEIGTYLVSGPQTGDVQAFDSPWRGTRRPLHGLLHGAYTFRFRAELLQRVLRAAARRPRLFAPLLQPRGRRSGAKRRDRSWLRRELRREQAMLARALADLGRASRSGLLTTAGTSLLRSLRRRASLR